MNHHQFKFRFQQFRHPNSVWFEIRLQNQIAIKRRCQNPIICNLFLIKSTRFWPIFDWNLINFHHVLIKMSIIKRSKIVEIHWKKTNLIKNDKNPSTFQLILWFSIRFLIRFWIFDQIGPIFNIFQTVQLNRDPI